MAMLSLTHLKGTPCWGSSCLNKSYQSHQASLAAPIHVNCLDLMFLIALLHCHTCVDVYVHTRAPAASSDVSRTQSIFLLNYSQLKPSARPSPHITINTQIVAVYLSHPQHCSPGWISLLLLQCLPEKSTSIGHGLLSRNNPEKAQHTEPHSQDNKTIWNNEEERERILGAKGM